MTDDANQPREEYWDPNVCPLCGNDEFDWGFMADTRYNKNMMGFGKGVKARQCVRCGNLQLFAEPPNEQELMRLRQQRKQKP